MGKRYSHYSADFFSKGRLNIQTYDWSVQNLNCMINRAQRSHQADIGFTIGGSVLLGIATGLITTGGTIISPKEMSRYKMGRTLVFAGLGAAGVAVPLFVFRGKCKSLAEKERWMLFH
jgi:hypothetical protein